MPPNPCTCTTDDEPLYSATVLCDLNYYGIGNVAQISTQFLDEDAIPIDPTTVTLIIKKPDQSEVTFVYPTGIQTSGTGAYYYNLTLDQAGNYFYRWTGSGNITAAGEGQLFVNQSNVLV